MEFDSYVGKKVKEDYEEIAEPILEKGEAEFDYNDESEINVILLQREYEEGDETFELSCHLIISLEDGEITDITFESRVWGDDALGDVNEAEICDAEELERMERTASELLKAITE